MKVCNKCGVSDFLDSGHCRPCQKKRSADWYARNNDKAIAAAKKWKAANHEKVKQGAKVYRDATKDRAKELGKKWAAANQEKVLAKMKRYYERHQEKCRERSRDYYARFPEKAAESRKAYRSTPEYKAVNQNNRTKKKERLAGNGRLSQGLAAKLFALQKGKCACCRLPLGDNYHLDHIMPLALGGANEDWNIQLLRQRCNNQKHAKHPIDFMQSRGLLC